MTRPSRRAGVTLMWMASSSDGRIHSVSSTKDANDFLGAHRVAIIDLRPEAVEAAIEKAAKALMQWERNRYGRVVQGTHVHPMQARAVLTALLGKLPTK